MKKILMIGGTGTISAPITRHLCEDPQNQVYLLNRGNKKTPAQTESIIADIHDTETLYEILKDKSFDCVIDFILYTPADAEERIRLFRGKTRQYIFISTNVALDHEYVLEINEDLPTGNKYSEYGNMKAQCEEILMRSYREEGFPATIVRPTQTYSESRIPLSVKPSSYWAVVSRILRDKEVIVHGEGEGIWAGTHAEDFARYFAPLVNHPRSIGEIYQIMNPEPYTWDMLYHTLGEVFGHTTRIVHIPAELLACSKQYPLGESVRGDKHYSCLFDIQKIREISGDLPFTISMRKGLEMYKEYMDEHPELKKEDPVYDRWCDDTIALYRKLRNEFAEEIR